MVRKAFKGLLIALIAIFALGTIGEAAAQKKSVRHRPRHSSRVSSGSAAAPATTKKKTSPRKKSAGPASKNTEGEKSKTAVKKPTPSTKPQ